MAFRRKNLTLISGSGPGEGPRLFSYRSNDTSANILTANYFGSNAVPSAETVVENKGAQFDRAEGLRDADNAVRNDMRVNDVIFAHVDLGGTPAHIIYRCSVSTTAAITVVAGATIT